jgi:RNA polymerase sigma-70 factor (ECF subfamily)
MMDASTLGKLLDHHAAALVLYARQWCAAPEDVVQEAFVKLLAQKRTPQPLLPWLFRVVRNAAISAARSDQRRRRHEALAGERGEPWLLPSPETALDAAAVTEALPTLPAEEREAITLHLWGGLTFSEIGEVMACSTSSAHRAYLAGLQRLRERILPCPNRPSGDEAIWNRR